MYIECKYSCEIMFGTKLNSAVAHESGNRILDHAICIGRFS